MIVPESPGGSGPTPAGALARTRHQKQKSPESPEGSGAPVGFINPGSLADRLSNKGSAQADNTQLMGRPKYRNDGPEGRSNHRPEGLAKEERRPLSDSGPLSDRSAHFGLHPASGHSLRPEGLAKALLPTLTPRLRPGTQKPCSLLFFDWHNQSRLGPTDRGSKVRRTSQTSIPGTIPCTPVEIVLCNLPDTNNVVDADIFPYSIVGAINSHMVRLPHMPLGIDSVVGAGIYRTRRTW